MMLSFKQFLALKPASTTLTENEEIARGKFSMLVAALRDIEAAMAKLQSIGLFTRETK